MIEYYVPLGSFIILFMGGIIALSVQERPKLSHFIGKISFILSLFVNTIFIIFHPTDKELVYNGIGVNYSSFLYIEALLAALFVIYLFYPEDLSESTIKFNKDGIYLILSSSIIGLFTTFNLLVMIVFYIFTILFLALLFTYDDYKKHPGSIKPYFRYSIISFIMLFSAAMLAFYYCNSLNINDIREGLVNTGIVPQLTLILLIIMGFGMFTGIMPFFDAPLERFFMEMNDVTLFVYNSVFTPAMGLIIIRLSRIFYNPQDGMYTYDNGGLFLVYFYFGVIGQSYFIIRTLRELFGSSPKMTRSISSILGNFSGVVFSFYLLIAAMSGVDPSVSYLINSESIHEMALLQFKTQYGYTILIIISNLLIFQSIRPILNNTEVRDLNELGGFQDKYGPFMILLFGLPFLFLFPKLLGYDVLYLIFHGNDLRADYNLHSAVSNPIKTGYLWTISILYLVIPIMVLLIVGTFLVEIFMGRPIPLEAHLEKQKKSEKRSERLSKYTSYERLSLIIGIVLLAAGFIFSVYLPSVADVF